jgi:SecD/SecF fusion protein
MQLKRLVSFVTIVLVLICLYQLSFTYFVNNFEAKQQKAATKEVKAANPNLKEDELRPLIASRTAARLDSVGSLKKSTILGIPYNKAKDRQVKLGLDLKGGMNVVLEVSTADMIRNMATNPDEITLKNAIDAANKAKANGAADFVSLFINAFKAANPQVKLASIFAKPGSTITSSSTDEQVIAMLKKSNTDAIKSTYDVINKRVDKLGLASPSLSLDENKGIINVELAGESEPQRVRKILTAAAKLEFWETYSNYQVIESLNKADEELGKYQMGISGKDTAKADVADTSKGTAKKDSVKNIEEERAKHPIYALMSGNNPRNNPETGKMYEDPIIGYTMAKDTATLTAYFNNDIVKNIMPKDLKIIYGRPNAELAEKEPKLLLVYTIKTVPGSNKPRLSGDQISSTNADFDELGNPIINMSMKSEGATIWENMTRANIGKPIAIVLDDIVYSAPAPSQAISGGNSRISGSFTVDETKDISKVLSSGKIDAPARIVSDYTVGPSLGKENIAAGRNTFLFAFLAIFILMIVYYNTAGMVANIALILNLLLTVGILASGGFNLTMAGIAGLVLTIGMAVDTNVIIFERIKEELAAGKTHDEAINEGYKRSLAPVLDGHITVFLTALILFIFGLGPILGFATTQMLGIALSLFCGILFSRLITELYMHWGGKKRHLEYFTGISKRVFKKFNFKFIEWRKYAYVLSLIVLAAGLGSFWYGYDYGVEFKGGRSYNVKFDKKVETQAIAKGLATALGKEPVVKTIGNTGKEVNIVTDYMINNSDSITDFKVATQLISGLSGMQLLPAGTTVDQFKLANPNSRKVEPTISADLKKGAIKATIFSIIIIFIYIFIRFRKWQYSLGTVIALLHDVFVALAVFSFCRKIVPFSLEIDQHFIAAILTVIGFSMNDTVIVFDRIREYFRKNPTGDKAQVINGAINDTLSRTIMTSLTVFLTILILFIFGGDATRGFAFAMLIGVITGTYSSIFVAAPVLVDLDKNDGIKNEVDREEKIRQLKEQA